MTPEAQRIAIAEACGWEHRPATRDTPVDRGGMRLPNHFSSDAIEAWWKDGDSSHTGVYSEPPRFLTDLNAMHEAEKMLTDEQKRLYVILLLHGGTEQGEVMGAWHCLRATAAQRAEALLRTIGKWIP